MLSFFGNNIPASVLCSDASHIETRNVSLITLLDVIVLAWLLNESKEVFC